MPTTAQGVPEATTGTTAAIDDAACQAWQDRHVERFRKATPPCHCFACLASRAGRVSARRVLPAFLTTTC